MGSRYFFSDVYPEWTRLAKKSKEYVWIFVPFFDQELVKLVSKITHNNIRVVIDFSPDIFVENIKQLNTLKKLMDKGYRVTSLHRLHAKLIIIDDVVCSIGSQNITKYARSSREVSVVASQLNHSVIEAAKEWLDESTTIDSDLLNKLLALVSFYDKKKMEVLKNFKQDWSAAESATLIEKSRRRSEIISKIIEEMGALEKLRVYGMLRWSGDAYAFFYLHEYGMHRWITHYWWNNGVSKEKFKWLRYYLILNVETNVLAYARIAKTRIGIISSQRWWSAASSVTYSAVEIRDPDGDQYSINFKFNTGKDEDYNIIVSIRLHCCGSDLAERIDFNVYFDGLNFHCKKTIPNDAFLELDGSQQKLDYFRSSDWLEDKLPRIFIENSSGFHADLRSRTLTTLFDAGKSYTITAMKYLNQPFLVAVRTNSEK